MKEKIKILIVDDQIESLGSLSYIFEEEGYVVTLAESGYKALELIKKMKFDVALLDINMPGIDGVETFKEIKKISPDTTVIMMTAEAPENMVREAIEEGAYAVLYKPFSIEKVLEAIEGATKRKPTILVVDDRLNNRIVLRNFLEERYKVVEASDGKEALEKIKNEEFDVMLLDIKLPEVDGISVLEETKKINPNASIVMMTAYDLDSVLKEEILKKGAYTVLYKPINIEKVMEIIEDIRLREKLKSSEVETIQEKEKITKEKEKKPKILIVDDDESIRTTVSFILEDEGFDVETTENGQEALVKLKDNFYNVAILDFKLPDMSGLELANKIKDIYEDTFIILLTGQATLDAALQAIKQDIYDFLLKPIEQEHLIRVINKALEQQNLVFEKRKLLKDLKKTNANLERLSTLKSYFISLVSHELKSPLTSLKGFIEVILSGMAGDISEEQRDFLNRANLVIDNMSNLINDILDLNRIEEGKLKMEFLETDINKEVVKPSIEIVSIQFESKGVKLVYDLDDNLPHLDVDKERLKQVIINLLTNALKFSEGGTEVKVMTKLVEEDNKYIRIIVKDQGEGFPPEEGRKIFDRFYQLDKNSYSRKAGIGLGLSLCKEIIERHNGKIYARSEGLGKGSEFIVDLLVPKGL